MYVLRHLRPPCVLALEDGRVFTGRSIGAQGERAGEVMGIDHTLGNAMAKALVAAGLRLPTEGAVFVSVNDRD